MEIIVAETGSARFAAWLNGELLCQSRTPTVEEGEGAPRFRPYKAPTFRDGSANSADRGSEASGIGPEQTAVCGLARATENA
jgi:hypothetical protein